MNGLTIGIIIGWVLLGIVFPLLRYVWRKFNERIEELYLWKKSMEVSIMTKEEHEKNCNQVQKENIQVIFEKMEKMMKNHKEWLEERLGRLESDMKLYVQKER